MILGCHLSLLYFSNRYVPTYTPKERKILYTTTEVFNFEKKNKLWKKYRSTHSSTDLSNFKSVNNELKI